MPRGRFRLLASGGICDELKKLTKEVLASCGKPDIDRIKEIRKGQALRIYM